MKKMFTLDEFFICFVSATAYGVGYILGELLHFNEFFCLVMCFAAGIPAEELADKVIFSKYVQQKKSRRVVAAIIMVAIFVVAGIILKNFTDKTLYEDLEEEFIWFIAIPIVGFIVTFVIRLFKKRKIHERYANKKFHEDKTFVMSAEDREYVRGLNKENTEISGDYNKDIAVKTQNGIYEGIKNKKTISYLGIPYAKAPIKSLRWKAPVPLDPSEKVYQAHYFGASELQGETKVNILRNHRQSEDCLYLNVWKSDSKVNDKKAVLVYIHGGDFTYSGSAHPLYDGCNYVENNPDVIFVSFNYRFGLLGFIDFSDIPGGEDYPDAMNLGLLDQIQALKWIHENIEAFGGDPDNITVMGDSAGGECISLISAIKEANTLFQKAVIISGNPELTLDDTDNSRHLGRILAEEFSAKSMDDLLKVSEADMKKATVKYNAEYFLPVIDGKLIPKDIYKSYENGETGNIKFIIGVTKDDISVYCGLYGIEALNQYAYNWFDKFLMALDKKSMMKFANMFVVKRNPELLNKIYCKILSTVGFLYHLHWSCAINFQMQVKM